MASREHDGEGTPGRARQKWRELVADPAAREVREVTTSDGGRTWGIRWVGEEPAQVWRQVDREWAERIG